MKHKINIETMRKGRGSKKAAVKKKRNAFIAKKLQDHPQVKIEDGEIIIEDKDPVIIANLQMILEGDVDRWIDEFEEAESK